MYETRDSAPENYLAKHSAVYGLNPYAQPQSYMEANQYSAEYASSVGQGYDHNHFFSQSMLLAPNLNLPEESQNTTPAAENMDNYEKKEPKCICKQTQNHIPRPRNAFILFRQRYHRSVFNESSENKTNPQVSQELGRRWRALSVKEKDHWNVLAEEERQEHAKKYPDYRYTPRRKGKYKRCQVCFGKMDGRPSRKGKGDKKALAVSSAPQPTPAKPVAQLSSYHLQYQVPGLEGQSKMAPAELQNGVPSPYMSLQQSINRRTSRSGPVPVDAFQYMTFSQGYPHLTQYGYMDNSYLGHGSEITASGAMLPVKKESLYSRNSQAVEYDSSQAEMRSASAAAAATSGSGDNYPLPTSMQQYLAYSKTPLRKVS